MKRTWKEPIYALCFLLTAALLIGLVSAAFRPLRVDYGAVWGPYLAEPEDSLDYLYLGSSYAYCDVDPAVIYENSGLTGYVLAGPEQTLSQTYWYLKEALKTQSPGAVLLETSALHFDRYQNYTQINVGYMPFGLNKLGAIFNASEPSLRTGLLFDLYFYHNRWKDLAPADAARALLPSGTDQLKGYTAVEGVFEEITGGPYLREVKESAVYESNMADLARIADLCRDRGIPLIVVFHPTYSRLTPEVYERVRQDIAGTDPSIRFYDWSGEVESIGLTPELHFYDPGHLNRPGAAIFSAWLGGFLSDELALSPRPQTAGNASAWAETAASR